MKTLYKIGMLAVAALAFAGCSKEVDNSADKAGTHTLTFKVMKDVDTKTAVVEGDGVASYVWTEKDDQYFHIYENGVEATNVEMDLSEDNKIATFTATFANSSATEFSYRATYGSDLANNTPHNPVVPSNQEPLLTSFDPAADVLVSAEDIVLEGNAKADENTEFLFKLRRVVSVNKMTLKGLAEGETIETVVLRSSDKYFIARYKINDGTYANESKELTLDYKNLEGATVGSEGTFPVYFTSAPVTDASFSIVVTTDQHVYTRDNFTSKLTLAVGTFRRFGINLSGYGEEISEGTKYTLVEGIADLYSGATYLIVGGETYAMGEQKTNNRAAVSVVDNEGVITIDNTIDAYPVVIEETAGGYLIKDIRNNGYLYNKLSDKNYLLNEAEADEYAVWSIAIDDGVASISNVKNTSRGQMRFNPNNGSPLFAAYATTSTAGSPALALYVDKTTCVELADPELSFEGEATINVDWADIEDFTAPSLNNPHNVTVTYSSSNTDVATVDSVTGEIEFVGDGTTVITATSAKTDVYKVGTAQYTLVVSGAPIEYAFTTIAELNAQATSTATQLTGQLTDAVVSFVTTDHKNAFIKDATGSVLYYDKTGSLTLLQGQTFSGTLDVTLVLYNSCAQITSCSASFIGDGAVVDPEIVTLSDLVGHLSEYQNAYVQVNDLTVVSKSNKNINVSDGSNTYVVYDNAGTSSCVAGDVISVKGTITHYDKDNIDELKAWVANDITITQHTSTTHIVHIIQPTGGAGTAGCTISAYVNGTIIPDGTSVMEGETVTLTYNEAGDYTFVSWNVEGASLTGNRFVVGTSDVTVSANFTGSNSETITFSELYSENTVLDGVAIEGTNFSVVFQKRDGGTATQYYTSGTAVRWYGGGTMTVSGLSGKTITGISISFGSSKANKITADVGTYSDGNANGTGTWSGNASSVVFTQDGTSGQVRITSITVTYQ